MSEERSYKKPLIVGGLVAVAAGGWLALGPRPKNVKEALELFRKKDTYHAAKVKVMGELLGRICVRSEDLLAQVADKGAIPELNDRKLRRTLATLNHTTLGDLAFVRLSTGMDCAGLDPVLDEHYEPTPLARRLYVAGEFPELTEAVSDNL